METSRKPIFIQMCEALFFEPYAISMLGFISGAEMSTGFVPHGEEGAAFVRSLVAGAGMSVITLAITEAVPLWFRPLITVSLFSMLFRERR